MVFSFLDIFFKCILDVLPALPLTNVGCLTFCVLAFGPTVYKSAKRVPEGSRSGSRWIRTNMNMNMSIK